MLPSLPCLSLPIEASREAARTRRLLLGIWLGAMSGAALPQERPSEAAVKAAYLFRFLSFVEWPAAALPAAEAPLVVGVLGNDEVAQQFAGMVAGRRVLGHPVVARQLTEHDSTEGLHALFVGRQRARSRIVEQLKDRPVLVVTESGLGDNGMLNFLLLDGRVGFEASLKAADRAGLKLGARLLALAEHVER
jgi:hypothetical protein